MNKKNENNKAVSDFSVPFQREKHRRELLEDCAQIGSIDWDMESGEFWWSQTTCRILGIKQTDNRASLQELIGFIHPKDQQEIQALFVKLSQEGGRFSKQTRIIARDGKEVPVILRAKMPVGEARIFGTLQNTSEEYDERISLLETLAKYRGVMSGAGDAIILLSHEGNILEGNPKAAELLEVDEASLSKLSVDDIHPKDEIDTMMGHYQGFLWGQDQSAQSILLGQKGRQTFVEITGRPVNIGSHQMLVAIFHDITLQQKAQNALIRSEQRYRSLVDEAREGILLLDEKGHILAANPKLSESAGIKNSKLLQSDFKDIADFDLEISPTDILMANPSRTSIHMEGNLKTPDGRLVPTGFNVARYKEQGQVRFIVTAYDLTNVRSGEEDRLELQKQLFQAQKQELLGQLAGSLAHDFNNLLSPILLVSEMLIEEFEEDEFFRKNLENINHAADRARRLVRRILNYTRPEESEPKHINLCEELNETLALLRSSVPQTITIQHHCSHDYLSCFADPDQIHQIIMNIGMNAAQAIGEKVGKITFELNKIHIDETSDLIARFELPEGDYVTLCVSDTGPGIPDDIIDEIFDPFFTTKSQTEGSGLGLSVVMQIATNHGGAVEARSQSRTSSICNPQKGECGATICVYLPLLKD